MHRVICRLLWRHLAAGQPQPAGLDRIGDDRPALRAVLHPQAIRADRPHITGRASHLEEEASFITTAADKHRGPLRPGAAGDPRRRAHPPPVQTMPPDRLTVDRSSDMEQFALAWHHAELRAAMLQLTCPLPVPLQRPAYRSHPRVASGNSSRRADHFGDAPEHSRALNPATDPRPALLELDAASAADHPPSVELSELGPGTIGQGDLTHETRRSQPRVRLISGLLTAAKVTRHARTLHAVAPRFRPRQRQIPCQSDRASCPPSGSST